MSLLGITSVIPTMSTDFRATTASKMNEAFSSDREVSYTSFWSERHVAYACGLGTFGLSKGIITEKGIAGRFSAIIIDETVQPDERKYKDIYENCSLCGTCVSRCPAKAICVETGKDHTACDKWLSATKQGHYSACGLCQTGVPCEKGRP